jgi:hypothetical protein
MWPGDELRECSRRRCHFMQQPTPGGTRSSCKVSSSANVGRTFDTPLKPYLGGHPRKFAGEVMTKEEMYTNKRQRVYKQQTPLTGVRRGKI